MRSPSIRAGLAQRARIVLLAGDGLGTNEIVRRTGASKPTVIAWKLDDHAAVHEDDLVGQAVLEGEQKTRLVPVASKDPVAYDLYLQATAIFERQGPAIVQRIGKTILELRK